MLPGTPSFVQSMPCRWALQRIFDAGCFAAAMSHFVNRQLNPFGPKATPTPEYEQELQPVAHAG